MFDKIEKLRREISSYKNKLENLPALVQAQCPRLGHKQLDVMVRMARESIEREIGHREKELVRMTTGRLAALEREIKDQERLMVAAPNMAKIVEELRREKADLVRMMLCAEVLSL